MSSNKPIKAKEGFHEKEVSKTAAEKRTASPNIQSDIIQTVHATEDGFFSPLRKTQKRKRLLTAADKGGLWYAIYSFYRGTKTAGKFR
jgi:hypothetical protein